MPQGEHFALDMSQVTLRREAAHRHTNRRSPPGIPRGSCVRLADFGLWRL